MNATKYGTLFDTLKNEILSGKYRSNFPFPSVRALINRFKLSDRTVRHALDELYAQGLISRKQGRGTFITGRCMSRKIGLIVPGVAYSEVYPPIVSEISRLTQAADYKLFIGDIPYKDSAAWLRRVRSLAAEFIKDNVAGVIFQPVETVKNALECNLNVLAMFKTAKIPVVLIGYDLMPYPDRSEYDVVGIDNFAAGYRVANHLQDVGVKNLCFFCQPDDYSPSGIDRMIGARLVMEMGNRRLLTNNVLRASPEDENTIRKFFRRKNPDAFVCNNDKVAAALCQTLLKIGVRVPEDVKVAGFDNVNIARLTQLTTVTMPCEAIARAAFRRLVDRISNPELEAVEITLKAPFVERMTTQRSSKRSTAVK